MAWTGEQWREYDRLWRCNHALGHTADDVTRLRGLVSYIEAWIDVIEQEPALALPEGERGGLLR